MKTWLVSTALMAAVAVVPTYADEYKLEAAGAAPTELAAEISALLAPAGQKVTKADGKVLCEVWFAKDVAAAPETTESDVTWKTVAPGTVIGAIRFPEEGLDRRGQKIKAGVYTMRFSMHPINGDHLGVAFQRDFLVLTPAADDQKAARVEKFEDLMKASKKASGTQHPAVLSMWLVESDFKPGFSKLGEHDWVLFTSAGKANIALILVGTSEA